MEENQLETQNVERQESDGWDAARDRFDGGVQPSPVDTEPQADPDRPEQAVEGQPVEERPVQQPVQQPEQPVDWEARYRAAEAEKEAMRRQLEQRQVQQQVQQPQPEQQQERKAGVPIPDEMKAEAKVFAEQYPDLADLLTEDSAAGRLIRKKLGEYGTEEAAAHAIPIGESRRAAQASQRAAQDAGQYTAAVQVQQNWGAVEQEHPDVVRAIKNGYGGRLVEELRNWAKTKPYEEGRVLLETLDRTGDAQGTCGLLARWKADMQAAQTGQPTQDQRREIARSMAAVPSRNGQAPAAQVQASEDSGWGDAKRRWG